MYIKLANWWLLVMLTSCTLQLQNTCALGTTGNVADDKLTDTADVTADLPIQP